MIQEFQKL